SDRGRARSTPSAGPSGAQSAGPGSARTRGAGMRRRTQQQNGGAENAYLAGHGRQVALAISESSSGRTLRRAATWGTPQGKRCRGRASGYSDLGKHASRRDALEHARFGQSDWAQPHDNQPHLAGVRVATPSYRYLQIIARPLADRESARPCRPVYEPAGSRPGLVRGREESNSGAQPHATAVTFTARATGAPHPRLQAPRDDFAVRRPGIEDQ